MKTSQFVSAFFTAIFTGPLIVLCLRADPAVPSLLVLGTLVLVALIFTVLDGSKISEFTANLKEGKLTFKKASQEQVEQTMQTVSDIEQSATQGGDKQPAAASPIVAQSRGKDAAERTDADYLTLATDAWQAGQYDEGLQYAYAGLERPASDARITAGLYSRLGTLQHEIGLNAQAEQHYRRAIEVAPDFAMAYNNLGVLLDEMDRPEEAEASYRTALDLDPRYVSVHYNLANLLKRSERGGEAEQHYRDALRLAPNHAGAHNNLGSLLALNGRTDEAESHLREALRIEPNLEVVRNNLTKLLSNEDLPEE